MALAPATSTAADDNAGASSVATAGDDSTGADSTATAAVDPAREKKFIEQLSTEEVKRFLDPTLMISRIEYKFQANFLPNDNELYTHRLRPWYAINNSTAVWMRLPYLSFSAADGSHTGGIGDISLGWGFVVHENLRRRMTAIAGAVEVLFPTGDPAERTGFDTYRVSAAALIATNPTDLFPVYFIGWYRHSISGSVRVRALELTLQTFHLLPRGFFLSFVPTLVFDLESDFNVFSFGLGAGRALNRRFSLQAAYVQHISGRETFNRGFTIGLNYLWGTNKAQPRR